MPHRATSTSITEWPIRASAECGSSCKTLKYLAAATAIVAVVLLALTALRLGRQPAATPRYATASGTPGPPQRDLERGVSPGDMYGDAPWALSALPECFRQLSSARGTPAFVRAKMPVGAARIPSGTTFHAVDCSLTVGRDTVRVTRGSDRMRVPPTARLYEAPGGRLVLYRRFGAHEELRVYARAGAF